jgi:Putative beta barrel porin-7 (BBP7)
MRTWVGAAVIAGCLSVVPLAPAQFTLPSVGSGTLPEPVPFVTGSAPGLDAPNAFPGVTADPSGGLGAPPLSEVSPGAFSEKKFEEEHAWYFNIGTVGFQRQRLSDRPLAFVDTQNLDTGLPTSSGVVAQNLNNIHTVMNFGVGGTVGFLHGCDAVELTGFYLSQYTRSGLVARPGQIDLPFVNPPLGFEGDNGLWLQADRTITTFTSALSDAEVNYRYSNGGIQETELIAGVRYIDLRESLSTYTDDDGTAFPLVNGRPDPTRTATYSFGAHNRIVAPQLGFEWNHSMAPWMSLGFAGKAALGANFLDQHTSLFRGDGFLGFNNSRNDVQFSHAYELNAFVDFHVLERARIHLGYNAMWLVNVVDVGDQYNFNLRDSSLGNGNGNVFFHGPVAQLEFLF